MCSFTKIIEKGKKSEDHFEQVDHNGTTDYTIETALDKFLCGSGRSNMGIVLRKHEREEKPLKMILSPNYIVISEC